MLGRRLELQREKEKKIALAFLFGSLIHFSLDQMFLTPQVLFWPLLGFSFPALEISISGYIHTLLTDSFIQLTELTGLLLTCAFTLNYGLYKRSKLKMLL